MKLIVGFEIEVDDDATAGEIRSVLLPASASFVAAVGPVGRARLASVVRRGFTKKVRAGERELEDIVREAVTR